MKYSPQHIGRTRSQYRAYVACQPVISNAVYRLVMISSFLGFATAFFLLMNP
jgi:hypothetical protein